MVTTSGEVDRLLRPSLIEKSPVLIRTLAASLLMLLPVHGYRNAWEPQSPHSRTRVDQTARTQHPVVPADKQIRIIVSSDAANEADDQGTIAYALLSPKLLVRGIVAAHFKPHRGSLTKSEKESTAASYREIQLLLSVMKLQGCVQVSRGSTNRLANNQDRLSSDGSSFIIREALSNDPRPLVVVVLGPLTDLAVAYLNEPQIAQRLTAVWIGGGVYPKGGPEYNQDSDRIAADVVMRSSIPLWQIPLNVYLLPRFSMIEAVQRIASQGKLGGFLFDRLDRFRRAHQIDNELWLYADLPAIGVLLSPISREPGSLGSFRSDLMQAPAIDTGGYYVMSAEARKIRVFQAIDQRAILEDFFAKLAVFKTGTLRPNCQR